MAKLTERVKEGAKNAGKFGLGLLAFGALTFGSPEKSNAQEFQENSIENTLEYDGSGDKFRVGINYGLRSNNLPMGYTGLPSQGYHDGNISAKYGIDEDNSVGLMYGIQLTDNKGYPESVSTSGDKFNPSFNVIKANYKNDISDDERIIGSIGYYSSFSFSPGFNSEGERVYIMPHPVNQNLSISGNYQTEINDGWNLDFKAGSFVDLSGERDKNAYFSDFSLSTSLEGSNDFTKNKFELGTKGIINGFYGEEGHSGSIYGRYTFENNPFARRDKDLYKWDAFVEAQMPFAINVGLNLTFTTD